MDKKIYTDEELIDEIYRFYEENGRVPTKKDMCNKNGYISYQQFINRFGSWTQTLNIVNFPLNRMHHDKDTICSICSTDVSIPNWYYDKDRNIICIKCYAHNRNFIKGTLNPNSTLGIGILAEYLTYKVLGDCEKCNTNDNFNAQYDLISEKYGYINVKSAKYRDDNRWSFTLHNKKCPDYYVCIGYNLMYKGIEHVWIIPSNSSLVKKSSITINKNNLKQISKYEVDSKPYNEIYKNLDIYSLPEFYNL